MLKLLLATANPGKIREYRHLLRDLPFKLVTLAEEDINAVVAEQGASFEENARLKAIAYARLSQLTSLADDSGLEIDALGGKPGVHSARFAGEKSTDETKIGNLLAKLKDVPKEKRTARFKCVIAIASPTGKVALCSGECHGLIALESRGEDGFGYDPIFYIPELDKTMAELPLEIKNQISHRGKAAQKARRLLEDLRLNY